MAGGFGWSSSGGFQDNSDAFNHPSPYYDSQEFNLTDNVFQHHYGLSPQNSYSEGEGHQNWTSNAAKGYMQGPSNVPMSNAIVSGFARPSVRTAPPQPLPPSQVQQSRGYYTDPLPRGTQLSDTLTAHYAPYDPIGAVHSSQFMKPFATNNTLMDADLSNSSHFHPSIPKNAEVPPKGACDKSAISLIKQYVKLLPFTFFFPENIKMIVLKTSLPVDTVLKGISQVLEEDSQGSGDITTSSEYSKSSIEASGSLRTTSQSQSSTSAVILRPAIAVTAPGTSPCFENMNDTYVPDGKPVLQQVTEFLLDHTSTNYPPTCDWSKLSRIERKPYQCTLKCGASFPRKGDLKRHEEEEHYVQNVWICHGDAVMSANGVPTCVYCQLQNPSTSHAQEAHGNRKPPCHKREIGASGKVFRRIDKFREHCEKYHPSVPLPEYLESCHLAVRIEIPTWCGFCEQSYDFGGSKARNNHMADHFEHGLDMTTWREKDTLVVVTTGVDDDDDDDGEGEGDDGEGDDVGRGGGGGASDNAEDSNDANGGTEDENINGDAEGDVDEFDYDLDHEMGGFSDQYTNDHEHRPNGNFSGESSDQSHPENLSHSFSTMVLTGCDHNDLQLGVRKLQNSTKNREKGVGVAEDTQFQKANDKIPIFLNPTKPENQGALIDLTLVSNLHQQATMQEEHSNRHFARSRGTAESTMEEDLYNARVTYKSHRYFIPITELTRIMTVERVSQELHGHDPKIHPTKLAARAKLIVTISRRLFALLIFIGKGSYIFKLIEDGIKDEDLPLYDSRFREISTFTQWNQKAINDFKQSQWSVISPIFDTIGQHYELDDHTILPFIETEDPPEKLITGGYGDVRSVRIHPAHLLSHSSLGKASHSAPLIALKRLHSTDSAEFDREAMMLRELTKKNHPHIVKLLATYCRSGNYHFIFPWATKNLRTYWQDDPNPKWDREAALWDIKQMLGIASGLQMIHNFRVISPLGRGHSPGLPEKEFSIEEGYKFGRHGDLKAENILYFHEHRTLQIADFGLGRFHRRNSRSRVDPRKIASTPTYEAPEIALGLQISRAYDIWSLGCLFLEYITWRLGGYKFLEEFGEARLSTDQPNFIHDQFYTLQYVDQEPPITRLPTRVINVGNNGRDPYLEETDGDYGHYAVLSYDWGAHGRFTTTIRSIEERKNRISPATLPKMIRDAINICRASGMKHLWIDSLCIIQDSPDDWKDQIPNIRSFYQEALFIMTAVSEKSEGKLLIKHNHVKHTKGMKLTYPGVGRTCIVQEGVIQWMTRLRGQSRCSRVIHDLLDLIEDEMLVVDSRKRITSTALLARLQRLVSRAEADEAYLLNPVPHDVKLVHIEKNRPRNARRHDAFVDRKLLSSHESLLISPLDENGTLSIAGLRILKQTAPDYSLNCRRSKSTAALLIRHSSYQRESVSAIGYPLNRRSIKESNESRCKIGLSTVLQD